MIHANTVVVYTSWFFHGFVSGSSVLASNRGRGTGWKFFRPAAVMAGFFVFANRGLILSLRIRSITYQYVSGGASVNVLSTCADFARLSELVHGSSAEVKLASAVTIPAVLAAFHTGSMVDSETRVDTASGNLSRLLATVIFWSDDIY